VVQLALSNRACPPPPSSELNHEIKHDGFCIMGRRDGAGVRLFSRNGHGLSAITADAKLTELARQQANAMAERRSMDHNVYSSFHSRITPYGSASAAENLAMGTKTFEETLATWKSSYGHNANLLNRNVTRMGLASASRDGTTYWALILAAPPEPPQTKVRVLSIFPPIILMRLGTP
jgi:hypothetical protein